MLTLTHYLLIDLIQSGKQSHVNLTMRRDFSPMFVRVINKRLYVFGHQLPESDPMYQFLVTQLKEYNFQILYDPTHITVGNINDVMITNDDNMVIYVHFLPFGETQDEHPLATDYPTSTDSYPDSVTVIENPVEQVLRH